MSNQARQRFQRKETFQVCHLLFSQQQQVWLTSVTCTTITGNGLTLFLAVGQVDKRPINLKKSYWRDTTMSHDALCHKKSCQCPTNSELCPCLKTGQSFPMEFCSSRVVIVLTMSWMISTKCYWMDQYILLLLVTLLRRSRCLFQDWNLATPINISPPSHVSSFNCNFPAGYLELAVADDGQFDSNHHQWSTENLPYLTSILLLLLPIFYPRMNENETH